MIAFVLAALSAGILTGIVLVSRGEPENSLIGLNVATICAVTAFNQLLHEMAGITTDIKNTGGSSITEQAFKLPQQHRGIALLGNGQIVNREFKIRVPQPVVQVFNAQ